MDRKLCVVLSASLMFFSSSAFAENCVDLAQNQEWMTGLTAMKSALEEQDYDKVLVVGRTVYSICPNSPIYLYYIAKAQEGKGDINKARQFIYKATDATAVMETAPQMAQMIWYARYEIDYPDRKPESVAALKAENDALKSGTSVTGTVLNGQLERDKKKIYAGTWTGAGIGLAGVAMTITGGAILAVNEKDVDVEFNTRQVSNETHLYGEGTVNKNYRTALGVMSAGIGIVVAGAIVTGVLGYQYTHFDDDTQVSFSVSPNQMLVGVEF